VTPADIITLRRDLIWLFAPLVGSAAIEAAIRAETYILNGAYPYEEDTATADAGRGQPPAGGEQSAENGDLLAGSPAGDGTSDRPAEPGGEATTSGPGTGQKGRLTSAEVLTHVGALVAAGERITGAALTKVLGCGVVLARRHLAALEEAGTIHRIGTGAGTRYELAVVVDPIETIDVAALTVPLPAPARSVPRAAPERLPAGRAVLPEDVLRNRRPDPEPAPADIDTVLDWLAANGDRVAATGNGGWQLNGASGWSERDLVKHANSKRAELGLPVFGLGRG